MPMEARPTQPNNPWPRRGWLAALAVSSVSLLLGLFILSPYQQNGPALDTWAAICRSLGITANIKPAEEAQPPLRIPSLVTWTQSTLDKIGSGNAEHGAFIALNCTACHGEKGVSHSGLIPSLAGMDAESTYKELEDFRSGKRLWGVMHGIAEAVAPQDLADVAVYFGSLSKESGAIGYQQLPLRDEEPLVARGLKTGDLAARLAYIGDPGRTIAPCAACHGPTGRKIGAPPLKNQQAAYIERQLSSFAQGIRVNDIGEQMRVIAKQLTPDEMHALAAFYARNETTRTVEK